LENIEASIDWHGTPFRLLKLDRQLVKEGSVKKVIHLRDEKKKSYKDGYLFQFNDLFLICSTKNGKGTRSKKDKEMFSFSYIGKLDITNLLYQEYNSYDDRMDIKDISSKNSFTIKFISPEDKTKWVSSINKGLKDIRDKSHARKKEIERLSLSQKNSFILLNNELSDIIDNREVSTESTSKSSTPTSGRDSTSTPTSERDSTSTSDDPNQLQIDSIESPKNFRVEIITPEQIPQVKVNNSEKLQYKKKKKRLTISYFKNKKKV